MLISLCYLETWLGRLDVVPGLSTEALTRARTANARREEGRALGYLAVVTALALGTESARSYFDAAAAIARSVGDNWGVANLFTFFSLCRVFQAGPAEPTQLLEEAMTVAGEVGDDRTLRLASAVAALTAASHGRVDDARSFAEHAIAAARRACHGSAWSIGLTADGWARLLEGDFDGAVMQGLEGAEVAEKTGEPRAFQALALSVCGWAYHWAGDIDRARSTLTDTVQLMRSSELARWVGLPLVLLAEVQLDAGNLHDAQSAIEEAASVADAAGNAWIAGRAEAARARLLSQNANPEAAESRLHTALSCQQLAGDVAGQCVSLDALAAVSSSRGHPAAALRLWAAARAGRESRKYTDAGPGHDDRDAAITGARRATGAEADNYWEEGSRLSLDEAIAYAARHRSRHGRPTSGWASLTRAELQVVQLVGRHLTNAQIAEQLFVSRATVKTHLVHIFTKLDVTSRSQLATEALRQHLQESERQGPVS